MFWLTTILTLLLCTVVSAEDIKLNQKVHFPKIQFNFNTPSPVTDNRMRDQHQQHKKHEVYIRKRPPASSSHLATEKVYTPSEKRARELFLKAQRDGIMSRKYQKSISAIFGENVPLSLTIELLGAEIIHKENSHIHRERDASLDVSYDGSSTETDTDEEVALKWGITKTKIAGIESGQGNRTEAGIGAGMVQWRLMPLKNTQTQHTISVGMSMGTGMAIPMIFEHGTAGITIGSSGISATAGSILWSWCCTVVLYVAYIIATYLVITICVYMCLGKGLFSALGLIKKRNTRICTSATGTGTASATSVHSNSLEVALASASSNKSNVNNSNNNKNSFAHATVSLGRTLLGEAKTKSIVSSSTSSMPELVLVLDENINSNSAEAEAEAKATHSHAFRADVYIDTHTDTNTDVDIESYVSTVESTALQHMRDGNTVDADSILDLAIIYLTSIGLDLHVDTAALRHLLAKCKIALGCVGQAELLLREVLLVYHEACGGATSSDIYTLQALEDLVLALQAQGKKRDAKIIILRIHEIRKILEPENAMIVTPVMTPDKRESSNTSASASASVNYCSNQFVDVASMSVSRSYSSELVSVPATSVSVKSTSVDASTRLTAVRDLDLDALEQQLRCCGQVQTTSRPAVHTDTKNNNSSDNGKANGNDIDNNNNNHNNNNHNNNNHNNNNNNKVFNASTHPHPHVYTDKGSDKNKGSYKDNDCANTSQSTRRGGLTVLSSSRSRSISPLSVGNGASVLKQRKPTTLMR